MFCSCLPTRYSQKFLYQRKRKQPNNDDDHSWKKKKGYTPLMVFTVLLLGCTFYTGQIHGVASLIFSSADGSSNGGGVCVVSSGTYQSHKDYCFTCGGGSDDDGTLNNCWNSQDCFPLCANAQGVGDVGDGNCGNACTTFVSTLPGLARRIRGERS